MNKEIGAVILAGGQSSRMGGHDKARFPYGAGTFLSHLIAELSGYEEILISANPSDDYSEYGLPVITDIFHNCGPINGLYSALVNCRSEALFVVSCDMPLFNQAIAEYIQAFWSREYDAFLCMTRDGRIHPLCGIYSKRVVNVLQQHIVAGSYSMMSTLTDLRVKHIPLKHSAYPDSMLANINTPEEYAAFQRAAKSPPVVAISGAKNTGKTTLLTAILPLLKQRGLRVAVIKHDGHDFIPDVPGTDSFRLRKAGAFAVAVYCSSRYMMTEEKQNLQIEELLTRFSDVDLILLEGGKHTPYPKIEMLRDDSLPVCGKENLIGFCAKTGSVPVGAVHYDPCDYVRICDALMAYIKKNDI